jgi:putative ABC transport system permease protein
VRAQQKSFSEFVGYLNGSTVNVTWQGQPDRLTGGYITWDFFRALGVAPCWAAISCRRRIRPAWTRPSSSATPSGTGSSTPIRDVIGKSIRVNGRAGHARRLRPRAAPRLLETS